ncbi:protoporphyrinogen oxidase [Maribellus comscasis]|uniref:Coproporphyrinogen III oxidase n=1 Tax=Maribellus comscasis TaxID=2681766 RepID=A0A6I6JVJ0_9BACT|nr:protoporphyrinogen oxidase [Maribellus comscasis]QGY44182.1 protoporphyrinogen oxidase [Maribellus comscasis]
MSENKIQKVAVVGAGLTGLTTAYYLKKAGIGVQVFEKADRAGGVIKTYNENGFTFEAGPNTGVLGQPEATELLENLNGDCELEIADEAAKARWIWKSGKWEALPSGLIGGIKTPLFTFTDKLRLLGEPFRKRGTNPNETLKELVLRRMGRSFLDYAVDPFILGIYSGDPAKLVPKYALPKLYRLEQDYGSFIGGTVKKARQPKTDWEKKATKEIFSVKGGLENLIKALVKNIGKDNIVLNCDSVSFEKTEKGYKVNNQNEVFSNIISTVGAYELSHLFPFADIEKINQINQLEYARVVQVSLGFKEWKGVDLKSFGGLVPFKENRDLLGVLFLSSFLKNRAPQNGALLSTFLGGIRKPEMVELNDGQIVDIVKKEIIEMMGLKQFDPDMLKIFRYQHAIPQYGIESEQKLKAIDQLEKTNPGLILAGNIRDGIGMADRIKQGKMLATQVISQSK